MLATAEPLPDDSESLKKIVFKERQKNAEHHAEIIRLHEIITLLKRRHFGSSSEKDKLIDPTQLGLFNEAESLLSPQDPAAETKEEQTISSYGRSRGKRKPLPENLPREDVVIDLPEEDRKCLCGCRMEEIGEDVSEKLDVEPMKAKVIRTHRKKYACKKCEESIQTAPQALQILPKSNATPGLLSFIAVSKYIDALPLYRLETLFLRIGVELPRTTMARWMVEIGSLFVTLTNLLREDLLSCDSIQSDETKTQVLDEPGKLAESLSYMWVQARAGPKPIILFEYDPSRSGEVPKKLLDGFQGYLQVDGYEGYNAFCQRPGVIRLGCFAHARRKFFEATKVKKNPGLANKGLKFIQKLYAIEAEARALSNEQRFQMRQEKSKSILQEMKQWLDEVLSSVPPETALGKAIGYAHREWVYLSRYIERGDLPIDNNFIENKIRPFALGRKNWLFSQSVEGAQASATLYSLLETAKANALDPYRYLRYVLEKFPLAKTLDDFEALLPTNVKL